METNETSKPFNGTEAELSGAADLKYILAPNLVFVGLVYVGTLLIGLLQKETHVLDYFLTITCIFLGIEAFVYLFFKLIYVATYGKSYIKVDKYGISGHSKVYGKFFGTEDFKYEWKELKNIQIEYSGTESLIAFFGEGKEEKREEEEEEEALAGYYYTHHFNNHPEFLDAIRTFGGKEMLKKDNIEEYEQQANDMSVYGKVILKAVIATVLLYFIL